LLNGFLIEVYGGMLYALVLLAQNGGQEKAQDQANPLSFLPFILIFVAFIYFMVMLPAKRERKQREMLSNTLKKNDEVLTNAGIIGIVANIKDDEISLKVDDSSNVRIRILKSSIVKILTPREPNKEAGAEAGKSG
jgi:preprotein translocase subunit YajC